jgi:hypothetical protein
MMACHSIALDELYSNELGRTACVSGKGLGRAVICNITAIFKSRAIATRSSHQHLREPLGGGGETDISKRNAGQQAREETWEGSEEGMAGKQGSRRERRWTRVYR